jgi:uncharacterized surface protein with fasciclin (FAS1) repeats
MFRRSVISGLIGLVAIATVTLSACGGDSHPAPTPAPASQDIVQVAQSKPEFSILVEAVVAADLATTLKGAGPFTVFAPTDTAFAALLTELNVTKAQLLANKPLLTAVLTYHVLPGKVQKAQVPVGKAITTLQGGIFKVDTVGADLVITDGRNRTSKITATDIPATNGVIHVIDKVLLPADKNIVQTAQGVSKYSILVEAVIAADLATALSGTGPFTVFAPTDTAFAALLTELNVTKAQLLADKVLLTKVLNYHVLPARVLKADVPIGATISTALAGGTFTVDSTLAITDQSGRKAQITATDILASNGVIHEINKVILPK